ncbi:hypothetical protein HAP67_12670 [Acidithiobacillus albertensis]|nr:hypothetical protein [Acidithiobacillus albertensis]
MLQSKINQQEQGAILVIVLVLIFAVTLALLAYLYLNKNNSFIASNLAVQNAAQEATDQGLEHASAWLNNQPTWPEISANSGTNLAPRFFLNMPTSGYLTASTQSVPIQAPNNPTYWTYCVSSNTCHSIGTISYGPFSYQVEYVIFPTGGMSTQLGGNDQSQTGTGNSIQSRYYIVFVHAMNSNGGGLGVTVQAVIRKVIAG